MFVNGITNVSMFMDRPVTQTGSHEAQEESDCYKELPLFLSWSFHM